MWPDFYAHPRRPVEWFMRCRNCGAIGMGLTEAEAKLILMNGASIACDSPICASAKAETHSQDGSANGASA